MTKTASILAALALGACFRYQPVLAADTFTPCRPGASVIYVNGVSKPNEQDISDSADALRTEIAHFNVTCVAEVNYFWNDSHLFGFWDLLVEFTTQKATELGVGFVDLYTQVYLAAFGIGSTLSQANQEQLLSRTAALIQGIALSTTPGANLTVGRVVQQLRDRVVTELGRGTAVVLVAHSQGNLFANEAFTAVQAKVPQSISQGMAVVNVANASINAPSGLWLTAHQDRVISALGPFALSSNFDANGAKNLDWTGHGFVEVYLSRTLPASTAESGSIAARLVTLLQQALDVAQVPEGTVLGSTSTNLFGINVSTSSATLLNRFTFANSGVAAIWDIAQNPTGELYYAISSSGVYAFDARDLLLLRLSQSTTGGNALAFNADGELYGMNGNKVYRFNRTTGAASELPLSLGSYASSGDLTFDSEGVLFGTVIGSGSSDYLIRIDLLRSEVAVIGAIGFSRVYGLYFSQGYLYGVTNAGQLITIDRVTGVGEFVKQLPFSDITGLQ